MRLNAYIDESGQRSVTARSSDHFVLSAVVIPDVWEDDVEGRLRQLRIDLGRRPDDRLHWENLKSHDQRLHAARTLGDCEYATISTVVVCKRLLLANPMPHEDAAYLYTFRFLLERLTWIAREREATLGYTLAHVVRFKKEKLRQYEARLRAMETEIAWEHLDGGGGAIDVDTRVPLLQLADLAVSATAGAFEPSPHGFTERRYLELLAPKLYRRGTGPNRLTSYGLKMHPWDDAARAAYPWVAEL